MLGRSTCLIKEWEEEKKAEDIQEIIVEELTCRYFKQMYIKHAFDAMGNKFKNLYEVQSIHLKNLKDKFKRDYAT